MLFPLRAVPTSNVPVGLLRASVSRFGGCRLKRSRVLSRSFRNCCGSASGSSRGRRDPAAVRRRAGARRGVRLDSPEAVLNRGAHAAATGSRSLSRSDPSVSRPPAGPCTGRPARPAPISVSRSQVSSSKPVRRPGWREHLGPLAPGRAVALVDHDVAEVVLGGGVTRNIPAAASVSTSRV